MNMQDAFIGLWREFQVPTRQRVRFMSHVAKHRDEWRDVEAELLRRCKAGEMRIGGMGWVDEVRKERKALRQDDFVLNNNWSPMYCRLFALKHSEYRDRFEFRKLKEAA